MRYLLPFTLCLLLLASCADKQQNQSTDAGRIVFDVSFPSLGNDLLADVLPERMDYSFSNNKVHARIASFADIYVLEVLTNNEEKVQYQLLKKNRERMYTRMNQQEAKEWLGPIPKITYIHTGEMDTIAGFTCQVSIAQFENNTIDPVKLYHTKEIELANPNWYTPYPEIGGVLLGYDMEQFGMRMRVRASEVSFEDVPEDEFLPGKRYKEVTFDALKQEFNELVGFFNLEG